MKTRDLRFWYIARMQDDGQPILEYATPVRSIMPKTSATLLFACGVGIGCVGLCFVQLLLDQLDILVAPACGCILIPTLAATIFSVTTTIRVRMHVDRLFQHSNIAIFGLGILTFAIAVGSFFLADAIGRSNWNGLTFLVVGTLASAGSPWIALRTAERAGTNSGFR